MHKLKINGRLPRTCARRQRPAIVGTGSASVKVIAAMQHAQICRATQIALLYPLSHRIGGIGHSISLHTGNRDASGATRDSMKTIILLFCSNVFMTFAWYGHLKYGHAWPLWKAILVSWLIAFLEYCLAVPANRLGFGTFTGFQLKIVQEAITVSVFIIFAITFLKERMAWNYAVSFVLLIAAVVVAFAFRAPGT